MHRTVSVQFHCTLCSETKLKHPKHRYTISTCLANLRRNLNSLIHKFNSSGAPAHNGRDNPVSAEAPCPFNFFRTGGDIVPDFGVVISKLQRTVPYLGNSSFAPISRPGCWAYPDMVMK